MAASGNFRGLASWRNVKYSKFLICTDPKFITLRMSLKAYRPFVLLPTPIRRVADHGAHVNCDLRSEHVLPGCTMWPTVGEAELSLGARPLTR